MKRGIQAYEGCYEARRAAALSGVPVSTVYNWARKGVVVPSVSPVREMLWSYADLMALRIVGWLRHPKDGKPPLPASPMAEVRRALARLDDLGLDIWGENGGGSSPLLVDRSARIYIAAAGEVLDSAGAQVIRDCLDLLGPVDGAGALGPDLRRPRSQLRIVPGKCAGEPHIAGTRLTTLSIASLAGRGYDVDAISRLYPDEGLSAITQAIDLEQDLASPAAAA